MNLSCNLQNTSLKDFGAKIQSEIKCTNCYFLFIFQPKFLMMPKTSLPDNVQQFQKVPKNVKIAHQNHFA